jgi:2,4-dienoyl-CoA reductase (NADPH2)
VAIVGAGGIGFDVAEYLLQAEGMPSSTLDLPTWQAEWGVTDPESAVGGLSATTHHAPPLRQITLLQRKPGKVGAELGKTTGWIHRAQLQMKQVRMLPGVSYECIDAAGLLVRSTNKDPKIPKDPSGKAAAGTRIEVDSIILCAGQESLRELVAPLEAAGRKPHVIGGAQDASGLDAKRAIEQGYRLGAAL